MSADIRIEVVYRELAREVERRVHGRIARWLPSFARPSKLPHTEIVALAREYKRRTEEL